jgi:hypothetical protein
VDLDRPAVNDRAMSARERSARSDRRYDDRFERRPHVYGSQWTEAERNQEARPYRERESSVATVRAESPVAPAESRFRYPWQDSNNAMCGSLLPGADLSI